MIQQFHAPRSVPEALRLKSRFRGRAAFLAGGTYVNSSECPLRPEHVISLERLRLDSVVRLSGDLAIGACITLQQMIEDRRIPESLKAAVSQIVSRNIRNMATIGGHLASNLPFSDLIPTLMALEATVTLAGSGAARTMPVATFVRAPRPGLITRIILPKQAGSRLAACRNVRASANARSTLSAAVSLTAGRRGVENPIVVLSGLGRHVTRITAVERELHGKPLPPLDAIQALVSGSVRAGSSLSGSAVFRQYQAGAVVALTLHDAVGMKARRP